jgi:hypothetical protein
LKNRSEEVEKPEAYPKRMAFCEAISKKKPPPEGGGF